MGPGQVGAMWQSTVCGNPHRPEGPRGVTEHMRETRAPAVGGGMSERTGAGTAEAGRLSTTVRGHGCAGGPGAEMGQRCPGGLPQRLSSMRCERRASLAVERRV